MTGPPEPSEVLRRDLAELSELGAPPADQARAADRITQRQHDLPTEMLSDAHGASTEAFAVEGARTADGLVAELRNDAKPKAPEAASLPDGTPHADPRLAARGWQVRHGVYVRRPAARRELEAG